MTVTRLLSTIVHSLRPEKKYNSSFEPRHDAYPGSNLELCIFWTEEVHFLVYFSSAMLSLSSDRRNYTTYPFIASGVVIFVR
jgi:VanZ family protein